MKNTIFNSIKKQKDSLTKSFTYFKSQNFTKKLNVYSKNVTETEHTGHSQAMLIGTGIKYEDLKRPQIGIGSVWYEGNPCNMHCGELSEHVKKGVLAENLNPMRFFTIGVSDAISMGLDGMRYSLPSREIICDSFESIMEAHYYDALIAVAGCDKNLPGAVMAMCRLNRPSILIYSGSIKPGKNPTTGNDISIIDSLEAYGSYLKKEITDDQRIEIIKNCCPGAGSCGGMFTANTMSSAIEALGLSLPYSSTTMAVDELKNKECFESGRYLHNLMKADIKPRDIVTKESLLNAFTLVTVLGGSTNAALHLIGIAKSAGIELNVDDLQEISNKVPYLANIRPSGTYLMYDLQTIGGTPSVMRYLLDEGMINGNCITVTGKTIKENLQNVVSVIKHSNQDIIRPITNPYRKQGQLQFLKGNIAPKGCISKISGKEGDKFTGTAKVYDSERAMRESFKKGEIKAGMVVVIRNVGPKGGPGMPEMLSPTSMIKGAGMSKDVALVTDGRFSGASHGFIIGHVTPEAFDGGNIALLKEGDIITIDITKNSINANVSESEFEQRRKHWKQPELIAKGYLRKYSKHVKDASEGCITDY